MGVDLLADRYELGSVIGRGRSSVYSAHDTRLGREVAVKRVALATGPDGIDDVRSRALREARAAARLASSRVVGVYDVVEEDDAIWLVMELVRAPSLQAIVRDRGPLPAPVAARVGLGVAHALAAAHDAGVLHRDVKPANVLVALDGEAVDVKLADFGVAALRDESGVTLPGMVVGSPSYMAPEQAAGQAVGPEADLWALGALLYFAVEGVPPFLRGSALATASAVVHAEPRPHHHPGVLTPLIDALLVKDPARRPGAAAVLRSLRMIAEAQSGPAWSPATTQGLAAVGPASEPTIVRRPSDPGDRALLRKARPHRVALVAVAMVALLGAAASQIFGLGTSRAPPGPPAADAQTTSVPGASAAEPPTTVAAHAGRRQAAPAATTAEPVTATPDRPADTRTAATPTTAPATTAAAPTTTTTPDGPDTTSGPPDTPAPTTTVTTVQPDTTPPTTVQPGG